MIVAIGVLADTWGLALVIQWGAAVGVLAAVLTLFLPPSRPTTQRRLDLTIEPPRNEVSV